MPSAKTFPGSGKFDSVNSTYKHEIILQNGKKLTGYSKGLYTSEMQDKIVLLERVILRLFNCGYLRPERTIRIEFFKRDLLHGSNELALILEPQKYHFGNVPNLILSERFNQFLAKLYTGIKNGKVETKDLKQKPINLPESDVFSLAYKRFNTEAELLKYVLEKRREGYPEGMCMNYYYKFKEKFLSN